MSSSNEVIVIGIAGCTRSGKTTLSNYLSEKLECKNVIHADHFWNVEKPKHQLTGYSNWECPQAVNFERLHQHLVEMIEKVQKAQSDSTKYIIIEGFLLFCHEPIMKLCNRRIFVFLTKQECFNRRMSTKAVPLLYFEQLIWLEFLIHNRPLCKVSENLMAIDGERELEQVKSNALDYIHSGVVPPSSTVDMEKFKSVIATGNCKIETEKFAHLIQQFEEREKKQMEEMKRLNEEVEAAQKKQKEEASKSCLTH